MRFERPLPRRRRPSRREFLTLTKIALASVAGILGGGLLGKFLSDKLSFDKSKYEPLEFRLAREGKRGLYPDHLSYVPRNKKKPFKPLTVFAVQHDSKGLSEALDNLEKRKNSIRSIGLEISPPALKLFKKFYESEKSTGKFTIDIFKDLDWHGAEFFYDIYRWAMKNGKSVEAIRSDDRLYYENNQENDPKKQVGIAGKRRERALNFLEKLPEIQRLNWDREKLSLYFYGGAIGDRRIISNIKRKDVDAVVVGAHHAEEIERVLPVNEVIFPKKYNLISEGHDDLNTARSVLAEMRRKKQEELKKKGH